MHMSEGHPYYQMDVAEVLAHLKTQEDGLNIEDAKQRTQIYGFNKLATIARDPWFFKLLNQFKDLMVVILIVAGSLSLYLGEYRDAIIMYTIVLINALISFFQEYRAEKVMDSLKSLVKSGAKAVREGKELEIDSFELVPGDIVMLEEGDAVPADLRIFRENLLSTNDFALTGESNPTRKFIHAIKGDALLGDRNNLVFMGTTVATGNGLGIVVATGMQTELGRIANLSQITKPELSPLQKELNHLSANITKVTLIIGAALFAIGLGIHFSLRESFLFALGVAASCVPEGMPAQVSVALSLAAGRLANKKAVVKKLSAVETLGSTHIICTDKTGTLTKNEMTVQKIVTAQGVLNVTGLGYEPKGQIVQENGEILTDEDLWKYKLFFENGMFASNARVNPPDSEHKVWYAIGDPTEAALITLAAKAGLNPAGMDKKYPELKEFTFDSVRKRMASIRKMDNGIVAYVKGSPQSVLSRCTKILDGEKVRTLTEADRKQIETKDDQFATEALRNLGYAYKELPEFADNLGMEDVEKDLIWLGFVSMIDPPREEVAEAMEVALKANIRVIIITGDYALTAEAIAKKVGLNQSGNKEITVVNGEELKKMSDVDLLQKLHFENLIFSRTAPEDKLRIVNLLKKAGEVVAVTGDGVNDAPALKKADIGVAMGKTGTDVAKDSAEIVLLDDSFGTLVSAIKEGRVIFQNLKKTILSSLTSNGGELFAVLISLFFTALFQYPMAILAVQILAIDLVGEMLPLTFLTWDPAQAKIMTERPRNPDEHIFNKHSLFDLAWAGALMGTIAYLNFVFLFFREGMPLTNVDSGSTFYMRATALTYVSIVLCQWMNILSRRAGGRVSVFSSYVWSNKRLLLSYLLSLFLILNIVYNPWVSQFLRTAPLSIFDWILALAGSIIYLAVRETYKVYLVRFKGPSANRLITSGYHFFSRS